MAATQGGGSDREAAATAAEATRDAGGSPAAQAQVRRGVSCQA